MGFIETKRKRSEGRVHKFRSVFSSPERKAPGELIGWDSSVVRPSTISNDFSSETTGPIATKFHIQPPGS